MKYHSFLKEKNMKNICSHSILFLPNLVFVKSSTTQYTAKLYFPKAQTNTFIFITKFGNVSESNPKYINTCFVFYYRCFLSNTTIHSILKNKNFPKLKVEIWEYNILIFILWSFHSVLILGKICNTLVMKQVHIMKHGHNFKTYL